MIFLGPLYNLLAQLYATRINHFALIKLVMLALDKTIFYFLVFMVLRLFWLLAIRRRRTVKSEAMVWLFAFYLLLLLMLTTFRSAYFPWALNFNWHRPLSDINLVFLKETWKMIYAQSRLDFIYNSFGNVLCFIPFGFLAPFVFSKKQNFFRIILAGAVFSAFIEGMQFLLETGISDIDDVFFNVCGAALGYLLFWACQILREKGHYTSAVFHGNVASFWNRDEVYKNMGYNYFFDQNYFSASKNDRIGYGIKDKLLFAESIKYLERMQQPFYAKFITVTNHTPFDMDDEDLDPSFKTTTTPDKSINNYFETAHYLDQAVRE
ncbi:hypothetical protein EQ500_06410, partial [Lactobacillus sp. XV13L]|nr:hypothetical protein [Lactobacillus sp. XV13L]